MSAAMLSKRKMLVTDMVQVLEDMPNAVIENKKIMQDFFNRET
jgi:hypothetical protein